MVGTITRNNYSNHNERKKHRNKNPGHNQQGYDQLRDQYQRSCFYDSHWPRVLEQWFYFLFQRIKMKIAHDAVGIREKTVAPLFVPTPDADEGRASQRSGEAEHIEGGVNPLVSEVSKGCLDLRSGKIISY